MSHRTRATIIAWLFACATVHADTPPVYYIYLAGPEVFLPQSVEAGEQKKSLIDRLNEQHDLALPPGRALSPGQ